MFHLLVVNIYDIEAMQRGVATLLLYALAVGVGVLVADGFLKGKSWW